MEEYFNPIEKRIILIKAHYLLVDRIIEAGIIMYSNLTVKAIKNRVQSDYVFIGLN